MKHNIKLDGYAYRLRPITKDDAQFIVDIRLEDKERNKFVHAISSDISLQIGWLEKYFERENDYYFVVENILSGEKEGLISIYNVNGEKAEWGRWVIKKGSMAAVESVDLIYKIAFNKLNLEELYSMTVKDNVAVVAFHDSINQKTRIVHKDSVELNGQTYDVVEQYVDREHYFYEVQTLLEKKALMIFKRNFKQIVGKFELHHIGIATKNIEKEFNGYKMLGYGREDSFDSDSNQGVKGLFITSNNQPRLELLENVPNSNTLDYYLENNIKMYHFGYIVSNIEKTFNIFTEKYHAKVVSPMKESTYFGKRICFLALKNMMIIELIEGNNG